MPRLLACVRKAIVAKSRNIKGLAVRVQLLSYGAEDGDARTRGGWRGETRREDRIKSSRPIPSGRGVVALHTSIANGDYRGSPRCTWRLGGKAISWEKGAGVTRPTPWRNLGTFARTHACARGRARTGRTHAYARVEHVVTAAVGVREREDSKDKGEGKRGEGRERFERGEKGRISVGKDQVGQRRRVVYWKENDESEGSERVSHKGRRGGREAKEERQEVEEDRMCFV